MNRVKELRSFCEDSLDQQTLRFLKDCQTFSRALAYKLRVDRPTDSVKNKVFSLLSPEEQARMYDIEYPHKVSTEKRELARQLIKDLQERKRSTLFASPSQKSEVSIILASNSETPTFSDDVDSTKSDSQSRLTSTGSEVHFIESVTSSWSNGTTKSETLQDAGLRTIAEIIRRREEENEIKMKSNKCGLKHCEARGGCSFSQPTKIFEKAEISFHSSSDGNTFSRMTFDEAYANTTQSPSTCDPLSLQAIHEQMENAKSSNRIMRN